MADAFQTFIKAELPVRPLVEADEPLESILVRREHAVGLPRNYVALELQEGEVLGKSGGVLTGVSAGSGSGTQYYLVVADETARDEIAENLRVDGLLVYTQDTNQLFKLEDGLLNTDWAEFTPGEVSFTNPEPTPYKVGGINAGSSFASKSMQDMWDDLLYPYVAPTISGFNMVANPSPLEVGETLSSGNVTFNFSFTNEQNLDDNTVEISSSTLGVLASGLALNSSPVTINIPTDITNTDKATETFTIKVTETGAGQLSRTTTTRWYYRVFWGSDVNTTVAEAQIEGPDFNSGLYSSRNRTYALSPAQSNSYLYMCWPQSYGTDDFITKTDGTTQHPFDLFSASITNAFGVSTTYHVYRTHFQQNGSIQAVVN